MAADFVSLCKQECLKASALIASLLYVDSAKLRAVFLEHPCSRRLRVMEAYLTAYTDQGSGNGHSSSFTGTEPRHLAVACQQVSARKGAAATDRAVTPVPCFGEHGLCGNCSSCAGRSPRLRRDCDPTTGQCRGGSSPAAASGRAAAKLHHDAFCHRSLDRGHRQSR